MNDNAHAAASLEVTGERLMPELQYGQVVHAEHLVRYQLAAQLSESRRVLDAACGEGYGSALLAAAGAKSVTGVDLDEPTIAHARAHYPAVKFLHGDVRQLPFAAGTFDLVVSFETIEHVRDPERALDEMRRVLAEDGLLVISTPNKHRYLVENEFHLREFFHDEFVELLSSRFPNVEVLLQHNWLASAVLPEGAASDVSGTDGSGTRFGILRGIDPGEELYTVAVCGTGPIPPSRPVVVAAALDEAHELAQRTVAAERTAERWHGEFEAAKETAEVWHDEYKRTEQKLLDVYGSVWWRITEPLRRVADRARRISG